ncbi:hypothetical protein AK830_g10702 [Neonectria ditissima]|uniref:Cupin type-2 domain-containing protein n=1 Tax=Neonectria ditissima TaxID=78410 RepID=A0A0P7B5H2_9HYPO|nr:hypothetical protein AK830_g10702 [Neonectria ditissima]
MCQTHEKPVIVDSRSQTRPPSSFPDPSFGTTTWHTLLSAPATPSSSLSAGVAVCPSRGKLALHRHKQAEVYYILGGSGEVEINGKRSRVSEGMVIWIPGDAEHGVFCSEGEELKWFYVFPEGSFEHVVYRFSHEVEEDTKIIAAKL